MVTTEDIGNLEETLDNLSSNYKLFNDSLGKIKGEAESSAVLQKSEDYIKNEEVRLKRMKTVYNDFFGNYRNLCASYVTKMSSIEEEEEKEFEKYLKNEENRLERMKAASDGFSSDYDKLCKNYVNDVKNIEEENQNECSKLKLDINSLRDNLKKKNEVMETISIETRREPLFVYKDNSISKLNVELALQHSGSYYYKEYMSDRRTADGDIFIDCDGDNDELIMKYVKNDDSLIEDLENMNSEKKSKLLDNMSLLELPIKKKIIRQICRNEDNEMMDAWREKVIRVNGRIVKEFTNLLKKYNLLDSLFNNEYLKDIKYYKEDNVFYIDMNMKYMDVIEDYLKNRKNLNEELVERYFDNGNADELIAETKMIGIELNEREKKEIGGCFSQPLFVNISKIIDKKKYDSYLREWCGDYNWKLIYRASEHGYTGKSFHEYCDDKGPTLIVIKSSKGWIFGGYTTKSWKSDSTFMSIYNDKI